MDLQVAENDRRRENGEAELPIKPYPSDSKHGHGHSHGGHGHSHGGHGHSHGGHGHSHDGHGHSHDQPKSTAEQSKTTPDQHKTAAAQPQATAERKPGGLRHQGTPPAETPKPKPQPQTVKKSEEKVEAHSFRRRSTPQNQEEKASVQQTDTNKVAPLPETSSKVNGHGEVNTPVKQQDHEASTQDKNANKAGEKVKPSTDTNADLIQKAAENVQSEASIDDVNQQVNSDKLKPRENVSEKSLPKPTDADKNSIKSIDVAENERKSTEGSDKNIGDSVEQQVEPTLDAVKSKDETLTAVKDVKPEVAADLKPLEEHEPSNLPHKDFQKAEEETALPKSTPIQKGKLSF